MRIPLIPHRFAIEFLALLLLSASIAVLSVGAAHAQSSATYAVQEDSKLWVDGTSTRSDWTVHAANVQGSFGIDGNGADAKISSGKISVDAAKIESGKSIMDRLMHDALKVKEHPTVTYVLTSAESAGTSSNDGSVALTTTGKLTLGGTSKDIEMDVTGTHSADGTVRFTGSHPLKMSDYGLEAPVAMFGALRTGDDVTIHFDIVAVPAN